MGGPNSNPNIFDKISPSVVEDMIHNEDDFIRQCRLETPDPLIQKLWLPFWKIRSEYHDIIYPIENNTQILCNLPNNDLQDGCDAIRNGNIHHPSIELIVMESATCYQLYSTYVFKLRQLLNRVEFIDQSIRLNKNNMLEEYSQIVDYDLDLCSYFTQNLIYSLQMADILKITMGDSILTGQRILFCTTENLNEMSKIYYLFNIPLPTNYFCRSFMTNYWIKLKKNGELEKLGINNIMND